MQQQGSGLSAGVPCSNVAAPVLCFSLVEPILRTLDAKHSYAKSLVMGALPSLL